MAELILFLVGTIIAGVAGFGCGMLYERGR